MTLTQTRPTFAILTLSIPGPDRKRTPALYTYRVTYRNPTPGEPGCVMTWEATGGRLPYQVALERTDGGRHLWHCSCADAVYRGEDNPDHMCKHVRSLAEFIPVLPAAVRTVPSVN